MAFPQIPQFPKVEGLSSYFAAIGRYVDGEFRRRSRDDQSVGSIILTAPDGSTWSVTVDNAGVLSTTQLSG